MIVGEPLGLISARLLPATSPRTSVANVFASSRQTRAGTDSNPDGPGESSKRFRKVIDDSGSMNIGDGPLLMQRTAPYVKRKGGVVSHAALLSHQSDSSRSSTSRCAFPRFFWALPFSSSFFPLSCSPESSVRSPTLPRTLPPASLMLPSISFCVPLLRVVSPILPPDR